MSRDEQAAAYTEHTDKIREALDSADYEDPWLADEGRAALSKLIAENARLREALERIYQQGKGPHVEIAREALNG